MNRILTSVLLNMCLGLTCLPLRGAVNKKVMVGGTVIAMGLLNLNSSVRTIIKKILVHSDEQPHEERWDWSTIDTSQVAFPKNFLMGAAVCEYQTSGAEGCSDSNWAHWESKANLQDSGKACDSWDHYERDITCLKELGVNSYRFSVDWSKIEPEQGVISQDALQHYIDFCDALIAEGIQPVVTLHHFVHPQWFEELGAFEKAENITYFVDFSKLVFKALHKKVTLWCTINEPGIYVMQGYVRGVYPPGKKSLSPLGFMSGMRRASTVFKNLLDAHVEIYHALKQLPGGKKAKIGIVHQYLSFDSFHDKWSPIKSSLEQCIASMFTSFVRDTLIEYFTTGTYKFKSLGVVFCQDETDAVRRMNALDFIGLNYYSHIFLRVHHRLDNPIHPGYREYDVETDYNFAVYAEGLYRAIKHLSQIKVPIYITENGAPTKDDACRDLWNRRYLYALNKAITDGYDVRGYFYWSLMDNYEWDKGYDIKFGLYEVDFETQTRRLRPGSQWFVDVTRKHTGK